MVNTTSILQSEPSVKKSPIPVDQKTDYRRWRLLNEDGRQTWHYLKTDEEMKQWPQSVAEKYFLGLPTV